MFENKVTWALVFALAMETASALVWAGSATQRLKEVETRLADQAGVADRLTRVEVHLQLAAVQLSRIERKLEAE